MTQRSTSRIKDELYPRDRKQTLAVQREEREMKALY